MNRPFPIVLIAALFLLMSLPDQPSPRVEASVAARDRLQELPREVELAFYRAGESSSLDRWRAQVEGWRRELAGLRRAEWERRSATVRALIDACSRRLERCAPASAPFEVDDALARARAGR